jgi:hypothetical protein
LEEEVLSQDRKASILWQCNLEEKEGLHLHPIGEADHRLQGRQDLRVSVKIENHDIRPQFIISNQILISKPIINPLSLIIVICYY